jgi:hypothetical protein
VNVDVAGGNLPTLNIPSLPGMPGSDNGTGAPGMPGMPGSSPGTGGQPGMGNEQGGGDQSGNGTMAGTGAGSGTMAGNDPFGGMGGMGGTGSGAGSSQRSVLDGRLEASFEVFDGMIIGARERAQTEADAAGSSVMGTGGAGGEGGDGDGEFGEGGFGGIIVATGPNNSSGGGMMPPGTASRQGEFDNRGQPAYPVPEDIPDGSDDDVVARQLREAAMSESDAELREKLWDEYRNYTGISR